MLLDIVRAAADQSSPHTTTTTTAKEITTATRSVPSPPSGNINVKSQRQQEQQASEAAISGQDLESVIMQKLLKYEKKAAVAAAFSSTCRPSAVRSCRRAPTPRPTARRSAPRVPRSARSSSSKRVQQQHHQLTASVSSSSSASTSDYLLMTWRFTIAFPRAKSTFCRKESQSSQIVNSDSMDISFSSAAESPICTRRDLNLAIELENSEKSYR